MFCYVPAEREAQILKPLASVEVTELEDATFETEISEDDVPGEWKLKGEVLTRSPVQTGFFHKVSHRDANDAYL